MSVTNDPPADAPGNAGVSATRYTPGPWFWVGESLFSGPTGLHVIDASDRGGLGDASEANLALLAAAPDMLDELQRAIAIIEQFVPVDAMGVREYGSIRDEHLYYMRNVVAKATGAAGR